MTLMNLRPIALLAALLVAGLSASTGGEAAVPSGGFGSGANDIVGIVQAPGGAPIVGVRVELLAGGRLVASTVTTESGGFRIPPPRTPARGPGGLESPGIRAERLGYATVERPLSDEETAGALIRLVMEPAPLPLPELRVEVASERCPDRSHPEGAALWEAMARLHPNGLDTLGAASYTLVRTDTLPAGRIIRGNADGPLTAGQRGFSGRLRTAWERRVERDGYAFPVRRTDLSGSFDAWSYAPLEADFASHFGTPLFARQQRFRAPSPGPAGGWIVPFCAADSRRAGVEGYLELSADTLLLRVDWRFRTPDPDEGAGGWTRFPETAPGTPAPLLLPLEAVVWRTIRSGEVQRRSQWFEAWTVTPGDSVPFLPERAETVDPRPSAR
ncbi:MAG: carboxypeptidase regulatory-like domain-containing protein [Gemmatimonadales bacterium]|nr:MAG: carboxypeptidase regulatory-like domain-containing protein [Gemmatimonadales bacterium]